MQTEIIDCYGPLKAENDALRARVAALEKAVGMVHLYLNSCTLDDVGAAIKAELRAALDATGEHSKADDMPVYKLDSFYPDFIKRAGDAADRGWEHEFTRYRSSLTRSILILNENGSYYYYKRGDMSNQARGDFSAPLPDASI